MATAESINVKVFNDSSFNNLVLVFARNYPIPLTQDVLNMAWRVMLVPSKGCTVFSYPSACKIGAFYHRADGAMCVTAGPFEASVGSSWRVSASRKTEGLLVKQNATPEGLVCDGYIIHNVKPDDCIGRIVTVALYKGDDHHRPFITQQCGVGNYVTFAKSTNKLYFGVMKPSPSLEHYKMIEKQLKNVEMPVDSRMTAVSEKDCRKSVLIPETEFTPLTEIDLNGDTEVTLTEDSKTGQFVFTCV